MGMCMVLFEVPYIQVCGWCHEPASNHVCFLSCLKAYTSPSAEFLLSASWKWREMVVFPCFFLCFLYPWYPLIQADSFVTKRAPDSTRSENVFGWSSTASKLRTEETLWSWCGSVDVGVWRILRYVECCSGKQIEHSNTHQNVGASGKRVRSCISQEMIEGTVSWWNIATYSYRDWYHIQNNQKFKPGQYLQVVALPKIMHFGKHSGNCLHCSPFLLHSELSLHNMLPTLWKHRQLSFKQNHWTV